jgi:hypothetical protein
MAAELFFVYPKRRCWEEIARSAMDLAVLAPGKSKGASLVFCEASRPPSTRAGIVWCSGRPREVTLDVLKELSPVALRHNFADEIGKAIHDPNGNRAGGIETPRAVEVQHELGPY